LGNRERRSWGTGRSAHRGGRKTGATEFHRGAAGRWLWSKMPAAAFRFASGEVKMLHRSSLSSRTPWRPQLPLVGSLAGGRKTAGGGPAAPGGAWLQHAVHRKERRGAWLGLRGKAAGVLRGAAGRGCAGHGRGGRRRADAGLRRPVGARLLPGWAWRAWERVRVGSVGRWVGLGGLQPEEQLRPSARVKGAKRNFRMLGHEGEMGCC
jgi:hypothetical protein